MNKTMLKTVRLIAPGVIMLSFLLPFFQFQVIRTFFDSVPESLLSPVLLLCAFFLGGCYDAFDCRGFLWRDVIKQYQENVREKIIKPHYSDPVIGRKIESITTQQVMRIFYHIIDANDSLKDQADGVRMSGAMLSTVIDGMTISPFITIAYIITSCFVHRWFFLGMAAGSIVLQILLWVLKGFLNRKHLRAQEEQLSVISQLHMAKVLSCLRDIK